MNIDPRSHEDVLLHMELLHEAREAEYVMSCSSYGDSAVPTPAVHVRKVLLAGIGSPPEDATDSSLPSPRQSKELPSPRQIPKPAFGMGADLVGVGPCGSPEAVICRSFSSSLRGISLLEEASPHSIPRPAFGTYLNGLRNEDDGNDYSSEQDTASLPLGYEVTFATTDRQGLLKYFTSALSDSNLQLNIKVCYFFLAMHIHYFFHVEELSGFCYKWS